MRFLPALSFLVIALFLAGCGGGGSATNTPPPTTFQITVTGPTASSGTVTSSPAGINCPTTCSANFSQGAKVTLTESPATGYTFTGWGSACSGNATTCAITVNAATTVTAAFAQPNSTQLNVSVTGSGTVTSVPTGINCPTTCSASFAQNTAVTLTASAGAGSSFGSWGGACSGASATCSVTITALTSVSATFAQAGSVTVSLAGVGTGAVTSNPSGINCPGTCSASFSNNTSVVLTATPAANQSFGGWSGGCTGTGSCTLTVTSTTSASATAAFGLTLQSGINHIVFLAQENRSLDHYFGALPQFWADDGYVHYKNQAFDGLPQFPNNPGAEPTNPGCDPTKPYPQDCSWDPTHPVTEFHLQTMCVENPSPSWNESHVDMNFNDPTLGQTGLAKLDGFVWATGHDSRAGNGTAPQFMDTDGRRVMGYYDGGDLNYYYFMASNFATSDRWFSPVMSRTNPNREYLIAATSEGLAYPNGTNSADTGQNSSPIIFEKLQNAGISWKIYVYPDPNAATYGSLTCAASDTRPECLYQISYLHNFTYGQTIINDPQMKKNLVPISQFYTDAHAGTLPQVAQIEPASSIGLDEHAADYDPPPGQAPCCSVQAGAAYVKTLIDAVMGTPSNPSPSWKDTVFVLTYDEFGGFFDHVAPQTGINFPVPDSFASPVDLYQGPPPNGPDVCVTVGGPTCQFRYSGYRVPLVVVSPFTKRNYVSHSAADSTAILKLIENRFNLAPLTARDAAQIDMGQEFLDLVNEPWKTPPVPPSQTLYPGSRCYLDHLP